MNAIRESFHNWLVSQGFEHPDTPPIGRSYRGSHIDLLWQCWRDAQTAHPDWSRSETGPSELWKNPLRPLSENLEVADGAIHHRDQIIFNLRQQLRDDTASRSPSLVQIWNNLNQAERSSATREIAAGMREQLSDCGDAPKDPT